MRGCPPQRFSTAGRTCESIFVGFSDDRQFFMPVFVLFVFFVLVIIVVGVSRRRRVAHDGDEAPVDQPTGNVLGNAWGHVGSCLDVARHSFRDARAKGLPSADGVGASGGGGRNCSAAAQAQPGSRGPAGGDAEEADCEEKEARCDTNACACCCPGALSLGSGTIRDQLSLAVAIVPIGSRVAGAGISFG